MEHKVEKPLLPPWREGNYSMRILFIADARSPIACNWINYFIQPGYEIVVVSTFPCASSAFPETLIHTAPIGLNVLPRPKALGNVHPKNITTSRRAYLRVLSWGMSKVNRFASEYQYWIGGPVGVKLQGSRVRDIVNRVSPDLVHAMRIPFEGILAAEAVPVGIPLLISVWGNDFTFHANGYPVIGRQTRRAMRRADALHTDCQRDRWLAVDWGFDGQKPAVVLPGAGGIQTDVFHPGEEDTSLREKLDIPESAPVVINPRGFRGYVRNDLFFQAIPLVLKEKPEVIFLCSAMQGSPEAEKWIEELGIGANVRLLPNVPRHEMADLFRMAQISISPSQHDGTPNTLLEAMACGCFPVAGDIESVHEWITDRDNGLLFPLDTPGNLAQALLCALRNNELRFQASDYNHQLIRERVEYKRVMARAEEFYHQVIESVKGDRSDG
jgi:glycosyltransferase involved in cell wall biosynthesis